MNIHTKRTHCISHPFLPIHDDLFGIIQFQYGHKCFLRYLDISNLPHALFALFLFLKELLLTRDVTAIALGKDILSHCLDRLPCNHLAADCRLYRYLKKVSWYFILELLAHLPSPVIRRLLVHDKRQCVNLLLVDKNVKLDKLGLLVPFDVIVEGSVPP